jgi:hypothetical protein
MPNVVFITNHSPRHPYDSALRYGAVRPVTSGNYPIFKWTRLLEEITDVLAYSRPEDYLLFSGASSIASVCLAIWLEMHGKCKCLIWDRSSYIQRDIAKVALRLDIERARDLIQPRAASNG